MENKTKINIESRMVNDIGGRGKGSREGYGVYTFIELMYHHCTKLFIFNLGVHLNIMSIHQCHFYNFNFIFGITSYSTGLYSLSYHIFSVHECILNAYEWIISRTTQTRQRTNRRMKNEVAKTL